MSEEQTVERVAKLKLSDFRDTWQLHGGNWHGPRIEVWTIPEVNFCGFMDAILQPTLAEAEAHGRNEALRDAAKVAETNFLGDTLSPTTRISEAILSLINTNTEEPK